jgi:hypothetical protein
LSDRLSRSDRRALQREDEKFLALPMNIGGDSRRAEAHIRHLVRLLQSDRAPSPCGEAVARISQVFDRTAAISATKDVACRRGCSHCCYQRVTVVAPEAFFIANHIRKDREKAARVVAAHQQTKGMSHSARLEAHLPCPMLEGTICSIHAIRPSGCRGAMSLDVNACIEAYVNFTNTDIPMPLDHIQTMNVMRVLLFSAMKLAGLPITGFELNGAIAVALEKDAERRWLAGEDIFASVDVDDSAPDAFLAQIDRMTAHVARLLAVRAIERMGRWRGIGRQLDGPQRRDIVGHERVAHIDDPVGAHGVPCDEPLAEPGEAFDVPGLL